MQYSNNPQQPPVAPVVTPGPGVGLSSASRKRPANTRKPNGRRQSWQGGGQYQPNTNKKWTTRQKLAAIGALGVAGAALTAPYWATNPAFQSTVTDGANVTGDLASQAGVGIHNEILSPLGDLAADVGKAYGNDWVDLSNQSGVTNAFDPNANGFNDAFSANNWDPSQNGFNDVWDPSKNGFNDVMDPSQNGFNDAMNPGTNGVSDAFNPNANGFNDAMDPSKNGVSDAFSGQNVEIAAAVMGGTAVAMLIGFLIIQMLKAWQENKNEKTADAKNTKTIDAPTPGNDTRPTHTAGVSDAADVSFAGSSSSSANTSASSSSMSSSSSSPTSARPAEANAPQSDAISPTTPTPSAPPANSSATGSSSTLAGSASAATPSSPISTQASNANTNPLTSMDPPSWSAPTGPSANPASQPSNTGPSTSSSTPASAPPAAAPNNANQASSYNHGSEIVDTAPATDLNSSMSSSSSLTSSLSSSSLSSVIASAVPSSVPASANSSSSMSSFSSSSTQASMAFGALFDNAKAELEAGVSNSRSNPNTANSSSSLASSFSSSATTTSAIDSSAAYNTGNDVHEFTQANEEKGEEGPVLPDFGLGPKLPGLAELESHVSSTEELLGEVEGEVEGEDDHEEEDLDANPPPLTLDNWLDEVDISELPQSPSSSASTDSSHSSMSESKAAQKEDVKSFATADVTATHEDSFWADIQTTQATQPTEDQWGPVHSDDSVSLSTDLDTSQSLFGDHQAEADVLASSSSASFSTSSARPLTKLPAFFAARANGTDRTARLDDNHELTDTASRPGNGT